MTTTLYPRREGDTFTAGDAVTLVLQGVPQPGDYTISHAARNGTWRIRDEYDCFISAYPEDLVPRGV